MNADQLRRHVRRMRLVSLVLCGACSGTALSQLTELGSGDVTHAIASAIICWINFNAAAFNLHIIRVNTNTLRRIRELTGH